MQVSETQLRIRFESEAEGTMPLLVETRKKTKHQSNERALWITAIVLGLILILLVILIASIDDYSWMLS